MAEYFKVKFRFTPSINYATDLENGDGHFELFLRNDSPNVTHSHLHLSQENVNEILEFNNFGSKVAKEFAYDSSRVCYTKLII